MTTVAILQSAYIPWKGYFDIIRRSDVFVVYDDVQYSKNHWHNRNIIKTQHGPKWLTIPVPKDANSYAICEVEIAGQYIEAHRRSIAQSYARAPHFDETWQLIDAIYRSAETRSRLSAVNVLFIEAIARYLQLPARIVRSEELGISGERSARLVAICESFGADRYLSGPSAQSYLDLGLFERSEIEVEWMDYSRYLPYRQLHGPFIHEVSMIDLLMNEGPGSLEFLMPSGERS